MSYIIRQDNTEKNNFMLESHVVVSEYILYTPNNNCAVIYKTQKKKISNKSFINLNGGVDDEQLF